MDPATTPNADFGHLVQYGAVGTIAMGLLGLAVYLIRQFVNHALEQNKELISQQHDMQAKTLEALHALGQATRDVKNELSSLTKDVALLFNAREGSQAHRIRPPRGGG